MKLNNHRTRKLILPALLIAALLGTLIGSMSQAASNNTVTPMAAANDCGGAINPATLPQPYVDVPYARILRVNQPGHYAFSVLTGALPAGLRLATAFGVTSIAGLPTTPGTYNFTIKAQKNGATCAITHSYTVVIPATVVPILECAQRNQDGTWMARFGYNNTTGAAVAVPVGNNNYFAPGAQNRGQTTVFQPGRVFNAFSLTFAQSQGNNLAVWFLRGPDNILRPVNALTATIGCPSNTAPVVSITTPSAGATFQQGDTIAFTGAATDAEDGNLSAQIVWTATAANTNVTTSLGTGASVSTASLAPGSYLATARVTDSGNLAGVAQVGITVNGPCSIYPDFKPAGGLRLPQYLTIDASGSYDTCNRPLKYYWGCFTITSSECPNFLAQANANNNTTSVASFLLNPFDEITILVTVCTADGSACAPQVSQNYQGAEVGFQAQPGYKSEGVNFRDGKHSEGMLKLDTTHVANFQFR